MNDVDFPVARVLDGIDAAAAAGLAPIKVNMVVKRGVNEQLGAADGRATSAAAAYILRFIEYMDVGTTNGWRMDDVVPAAEIVRRDRRRDGRSSRCPPNYPGEVAERWRYRDGGGEIGVIASVTQPFCGDCTRARLSAEGELYTCLFAGAGPRPARACCAAARATTQLARRCCAASGGARSDRYSELRTAADRRPAQGRDVPHRRLIRSTMGPRAVPRHPATPSATMQGGMTTLTAQSRTRIDQRILPKGWPDFLLQLVLFAIVDLLYEASRTIADRQRGRGVRARARRGQRRADAGDLLGGAPAAAGRWATPTSSTSPT